MDDREAEEAELRLCTAGRGNPAIAAAIAAPKSSPIVAGTGAGVAAGTGAADVDLVKTSWSCGE